MEENDKNPVLELNIEEIKSKLLRISSTDQVPYSTSDIQNIINN